MNYYVIINWFNVAKYRIAKYDEFFAALMAVARSLRDACGEDTRKRLGDLSNVRLNSKGIRKWFYPTLRLTGRSETFTTT